MVVLSTAGAAQKAGAAAPSELSSQLFTGNDVVNPTINNSLQGKILSTDDKHQTALLRLADGSTRTVSWFGFMARDAKIGDWITLGDPSSTTLNQELQDRAADSADPDPQRRSHFLDLQDRLYRAGFMGSNKPTRGTADDATMGALNHALQVAARENVSLDQAIDDSIANNPNGPTNTKKAVRAYNLTSKDAVKSEVQKVAPNVIGMPVSEGTIAQLTAQYNSMEQSAADTQYNASDMNANGENGGAVTGTKPPALPDFIEQQLREQNPVASKGTTVGHFLAEFMNLLGGSRGTTSTFKGA